MVCGTHTVCVGYVEVDTVKYWREVHCRRKEALVEVYELVEHGRQWWRALIYTSDASLSLGVPPPPAPVPASRRLRRSWCGRRTAGARRPDCSTERGSSLEISRTAKRRELHVRQTYVPARCLRGLLPDALLETFVFWRNHDDASLSGYEEGQITDRVETLRVRLSGSIQQPRCDVIRLVLRRGSSVLNDDLVLPDNLEGFGIDTPETFAITEKAAARNRRPSHRSYENSTPWGMRWPGRRARRRSPCGAARKTRPRPKCRSSSCLACASR